MPGTAPTPRWARRERCRRAPADVTGSRCRGGVAAEAEFLRYAAALTPDAAGRAHRSLASAEAARRAGDLDGALHALVTAEAGPLDRRGRADADLLRARLALSAGAADAARRLHEAARRLESLDVDLAREAYLDTLAATVRFGSDERCDPVEVASAALAARPSARRGPPTFSSTGWRCNSRRATQQRRQRSAARSRRSPATFSADDDLGSGWLASHVASALAVTTPSTRSPSGAFGSAGRQVSLRRWLTALAQLAIIRVRHGNLQEADRLLRELDRDETPTRSEPSRLSRCCSLRTAGSNPKLDG